MRGSCHCRYLFLEPIGAEGRWAGLLSFERRGCGHRPAIRRRCRPSTATTSARRGFVARSRCSRCDARHPQVAIRVSPSYAPRVRGYLTSPRWEDIISRRLEHDALLRASRLRPPPRSRPGRHQGRASDEFRMSGFVARSRCSICGARHPVGRHQSLAEQRAEDNHTPSV